MLVFHPQLACQRTVQRFLIREVYIIPPDLIDMALKDGHGPHLVFLPV